MSKKSVFYALAGAVLNMFGRIIVTLVLFYPMQKCFDYVGGLIMPNVLGQLAISLALTYAFFMLVWNPLPFWARPLLRLSHTDEQIDALTGRDRGWLTRKLGGRI